MVDITPKVLADPDVAFPGHYTETPHLVPVIRGEEELIVKKYEVFNVIRALQGSIARQSWRKRLVQFRGLYAESLYTDIRQATYS